MSKVSGQPPTDTLSNIVDLLVEHRIKIDALEQVLKETNPLAHELYLGAVENLRGQKATELKKIFTRRLTSKLGDG